MKNSYDGSGYGSGYDYYGDGDGYGYDDSSGFGDTVSWIKIGQIGNDEVLY